MRALVAAKDKDNSQLSVQLETVTLQHQQNQIEKTEFQKQRDLCRFQLETVQDILKKKSLLRKMLEALYGPNPTQTTLLEVTGETTTVLEEYREKTEG